MLPEKCRVVFSISLAGLHSTLDDKQKAAFFHKKTPYPGFGNGVVAVDAEIAFNGLVVADPQACTIMNFRIAVIQENL